MTDLPALIKCADLTVDGVRPENTSVRTVLLELPQGKGYIFGLIECQHREADFRERMLHVVASNLEGFKADLASDGNVPRRFESMLVRLNADLARLGAETRMPLKKFKCVIGAMTDSQVFISGLGNAHVLFLHRSAERRYVIYELDQQFQGLEIAWEKPFVTVLDGELNPGDVLYIATRIPPHALSLTDLQDILVTLPPAGALERAQQFVPANCLYGALCFHVVEEQRGGPPKKANPIVSLANFEETKHRTADLLGEQVPDPVGGIRSFVQNMRKRLNAPGSRGPGVIAKRALQLAITSAVTLIGFLAKGTRLIWNKLAKGKLRYLPGEVFGKVMAGVRQAATVSRTTKVAAGIVVILVLALVGTLYESKSSKLAAEVEAAYQTTVDKIDEKRVAAEASIIYHNTKDAQTAINDALALVASLPRDTGEHTTRAQELETALTTLLAKTRGIETVTPDTVATTTSTLSGFLAAGDAIYAIDGNFIPYRLNELSKSIEQVDVGIGTLSGLVTATGEGADILAVDYTKRLGRVSPANRTVSPLTSGVAGLASVEDIVTYNDNLYVLAADSQQVVKMRPQGLGYEAGTTWITARDSDLANASAIAVDGSLYMLVGSRVIRFESGRERTWDHAPIDPSLEQPKDLWTSVDSRYLYILDSVGRIIVLEKETGNLIVQYTSDTFANAVGFVVREAENRILIATSTNIQSFTATHLLE